MTDELSMCQIVWHIKTVIAYLLQEMQTRDLKSELILYMELTEIRFEMYHDFDHKWL